MALPETMPILHTQKIQPINILIRISIEKHSYYNPTKLKPQNKIDLVKPDYRDREMENAYPCIFYVGG